MNQKRLLLSAILGIAGCLAAQNKVIFQDNFNDAGKFKKTWRSHTSPGKSSYETGSKGLTVTVRNNPFHDGYIECDIPLIKRGMLEFDMEYPDPSNSSGIGLFVEIYNISTFFHSAVRDWRAYFPEPESKRIEGFHIEPVGHRKITNVAKKGKSHYRILFDMEKDRVEFFKDDMSDPALIQGNISVFGHAFYRGGKIRIGSMGYASKPYQYRVSNLKLTELKEDSSVQQKRDGILLFQGMTFDELKIYEALIGAGYQKKNISRYNLVNVGSSTIIINRFQYDRVPGENRLKQAKLIVLADAPAGPDNILPDFILKDMADFVRNGGRLVIFGGFFTLEKGEYQETPLAEVLPVELGSPHTTGKLKKPTAIKSAHPDYNWLNAEKFNVRFYHDLKVKKNAEVKLTVDKKPILVEWQCGKGSVAVFLGKKSGFGTLFTDHPQWIKLAAQICKERN